MKQHLEQIGELSLQLKLTPNVLLNLELLQLPILKLEEAIRKEIEENPLLEIEENQDENEEVEKENTVYDFVIEDGNIAFYEPKESEDVVIPSGKTLQEILIEQARLELRSREFPIAKFIIENLDERGYLLLSEEEISKELKVPLEKVKEVREKVKRFHPVGCGCYDLLESFKVQLEELEVPEKFLKALEKLKLLRKGRERFKREVGFSEKEVEEFLKVLQRLDPEPGNLGTFNVKVVPDLKVKLVEDKILVEVVNPKSFSVKVNSYYLKYATTEELKKFIEENYKTALGLKKAIEQRAETLKKIGKVIFKVQKEFLKDGKTLKPLSYQEVAKALSLHESTVSRAVKDKFVETPFGTFPLKFFFRRGISEESVDSIKEKIRKIIESEDKKKPLSDSKIAEILKSQGIKIARRTVAKYREEMGIPGVFERRER